MKTVRRIKATADKVEDNRRWSTRRAERAPGTPFSFGLVYRRKSVSTPKNPSAAIFAAPPTKTMARAFIKKHNCRVILKRVHEFAPLRT